MSPPVEILYEDAALLAVSKPAGLLTQAPPGIDSLELRIKTYLRRQHPTPGSIYLGVPHRLDRPASGAMIFAKHSRAARRISKQFERRRLAKVYWACTQGIVLPAAGSWTDYVRKIPGQPRAEIVSSGDADARLAVLHYRTLGQTPYGSWLELRLETGRTHQIRIQAASRNWPLLGDRHYGGTQPFGEQFEDERLRAIALHARLLGLAHPMTRQPLTVVAPLPRDWLSLGVSEPRTDP
jgi:RluA family pseudouridine synthase